MITESVKEQVRTLAATCTQAQIAERTGLSRSQVCRLLVYMGVKTSSPVGRPRSKAVHGVCPSCSKTFRYDCNQRVHVTKGQQPCCSPECVRKRQRDWALSYEGYQKGPAANRWKHGFYSVEARQARITIAAINRWIKQGANQ